MTVFAVAVGVVDEEARDRSGSPGGRRGRAGRVRRRWRSGPGDVEERALDEGTVLDDRGSGPPARRRTAVRCRHRRWSRRAAIRTRRRRPRHRRSSRSGRTSRTRGARLRSTQSDAGCGARSGVAAADADGDAAGEQAAATRTTARSERDEPRGRPGASGDASRVSMGESCAGRALVPCARERERGCSIA